MDIELRNDRIPRIPFDHQFLDMRAFRHNFQISNFTSVFFLPSYKTWKDQISDIDAGCVNKTYHDLCICDEMDVPLWSECR